MKEIDYLNYLRIEQGWEIIFNSGNDINNEFDNQPLFDNTVVFEAVNEIIGKEFYIEYENEQVGYVLNEILLKRDNFNFDYDENSKIYNTLLSNSNLKIVLEELSTKINPNNLDFVSLRIYGGWKILLNRFFNSDKSYNEREFLFLAIKNKNIIEILFDKETGYLANTGKLKNKKQTDFINFQDVENSKSSNFSDIETLVDFMENYFIKPE
ncbi:hypothetical protein V3468_00480 [Flavobacterium oreochromis]|uniref:Uncharacterized protein n=1 Tax=Flavobacterium oreochromis TaxID=2906078 RepID=A0ABW8P4U6_9FLAO